MLVSFLGKYSSQHLRYWVSVEQSNEILINDLLLSKLVNSYLLFNCLYHVEDHFIAWWYEILGSIIDCMNNSVVSLITDASDLFWVADEFYLLNFVKVLVERLLILEVYPIVELREFQEHFNDLRLVISRQHMVLSAEDTLDTKVEEGRSYWVINGIAEQMRGIHHLKLGYEHNWFVIIISNDLWDVFPDMRAIISVKVC